MRVGCCVKMTGYRMVRVMLTHRPEVFYKAVIQYAFNFSNVEYAMLGTANTIHRIVECTGEMLLHLERLIRPLDGEQRGGEWGGLLNLSYLHDSLSRPTSCKDSIPFSQFLHPRRICSDDATFQNNGSDMAFAFHNRGVPLTVVDRPSTASDLSPVFAILPLLINN
eukprot:g40735.t1